MQIGNCSDNIYLISVNDRQETAEMQEPNNKQFRNMNPYTCKYRRSTQSHRPTDGKHLTDDNLLNLNRGNFAWLSDDRKLLL